MDLLSNLQPVHRSGVGIQGQAFPVAQKAVGGVGYVFVLKVQRNHVLFYRIGKGIAAQRKA